MGETRRLRAPAMSPDDRRAAIVAATLPLIIEHGATVTTGQIAAASGVPRAPCSAPSPTSKSY